LPAFGLDPHQFGTHSLRRAKATLIYRRTGNLRAVQLLLGHTKIESTVRYLGIEVDDEHARDMARAIAKSWAGRTSRRLRKKVEMLFAHLKRILKLDRLRLRGPNGAHDEFLLAATAQNLRKLAKLIPMPQPTPA
jgi:uncharacterized protein with von Willebrand factor type A (vWA) domain